MKLSLGYLTTANKKEAKDIVMALLEEGLIACANIFDKVDSYFVWEEHIQHDKEVVVIFKTRSKNEKKIIRLVQSLHSYECPCIVFSTLDHGNTAFMRWVEGSC